MMTKSIKYGILAVVLFSSFLKAQQSLQEQYDYALKLYNTENYFDAVTEFKRLNFFDQNKEYAYRSNMFIGKSYKEGGKFSEALKYFTLAEIAAVKDSDLFDAKIYTVRINILRRSIPGALRLLERMDAEARFNKRKQDITYWRGWAYMFEGRWDDAAAAYQSIGYDSLKVLCEGVSSDQYNVTTAKVLSYIIPGAGQFYTGHYFSGLLSLGWNVLWGYLTVKAFIDERIFDGIVVGNFLWLRFYSGNIQNAGKFAESENIAIENKALNYLQYRYSGPKP
jgi:tetratricopeptide (TPR) repeat protein